MKISEIATLAGTVKKFSKAEANKVFLELLEVLDPGYIECEKLAGLYNFFKPPVPKTPKTDHGWVSKAIGIKDVRYYLNHLHSDGEKLTATDGHRLHQCVKSELPIGYYDNQLNIIDCDAKYPEDYPSWESESFSLCVWNNGTLTLTFEGSVMQNKMLSVLACSARKIRKEQGLHDYINIEH